MLKPRSNRRDILKKAGFTAGGTALLLTSNQSLASTDAGSVSLNIGGQITNVESYLNGKEIENYDLFSSELAAGNCDKLSSSFRENIDF